jgi:hypothetical protein
VTHLRFPVLKLPPVLDNRRVPLGTLGLATGGLFREARSIQSAAIGRKRPSASGNRARLPVS